MNKKKVWIDLHCFFVHNQLSYRILINKKLTLWIMEHFFAKMNLVVV